jgi:hypothetical protein
LTGQRVSERVDGDRRVSTWRAAGVSVFDAQCSARRWEVLGDATVQVLHLRDADSRAQAARILAFARQAIGYYASRYGTGTDTDAETTFIMQMPKYGDISSGNVSGISDAAWQAFDDDWVAKYLLAHELVHPYTGRRIARSDPLWSFVIEGFPSYFHLPFLAQALGPDWYRDRIATVQQRYLTKRETGLSRRGNPLPPEKPIDRIGADELSTWKDTFVLDDRVVLFWDYLRRELGADRFAALCRDLFGRARLTAGTIRASIVAAYPGPADHIDAWLSTTDFPAWMHVTPAHRH